MFIDVGLNMIGKKIKEKIGSGKTITNREIIKDIMKVIMSLENRGILETLLVKKEDFSIFLGH